MAKRILDKAKNRNLLVKAVRKFGSVNQGAAAIGISPQTIRSYIQEVDTSFAHRLMRAELNYRNDLQQEMIRRAVEGVENPIINKQTGAIVGYEVKYSDTLLKYLDEKADPNRGRSVVEHKHEVFGSIEQKHKIDYSQLPREDRMKLLEVLRSNKEREEEQEELHTSVPDDYGEETIDVIAESITMPEEFDA